MNFDIGVIDYEEGDRYWATMGRLERGYGLPDHPAAAPVTPETVFVKAVAPARYVYDGRVLSIVPPGADVELDAAEALGLVP